MRFVVHVAVGDCQAARASIEEIADEARSVAGERLRAALVRDANRHRHAALDDAALSAIGDEVAACVREGLADREGRTWTVLTGNGRADRRPGHYATMTRASAPLAYVEAVSDAKVAETEEFLSNLLSGPASDRTAA